MSWRASPARAVASSVSTARRRAWAWSWVSSPVDPARSAVGVGELGFHGRAVTVPDRGLDPLGGAGEPRVDVLPGLGGRIDPGDRGGIGLVPPRRVVRNRDLRAGQLAFPALPVPGLPGLGASGLLVGAGALLGPAGDPLRDLRGEQQRGPPILGDGVVQLVVFGDTHSCLPLIGPARCPGPGCRVHGERPALSFDPGPGPRSETSRRRGGGGAGRVGHVGPEQVVADGVGQGPDLPGVAGGLRCGVNRPGGADQLAQQQRVPGRVRTSRDCWATTATTRRTADGSARWTGRR